VTASTAIPSAGNLANPVWGPRENFRELLVRSATWQTWCTATGTTLEKQATARGQIYHTGIDGASVVAARPFALIFAGEDWKHETEGAGALGIPGGSFGVIFEADVPGAHAATHGAEEWLSLKIGTIIAELEAQTTSEHLLINMGIAFDGVPERSDVSMNNDEGDFIAVAINVTWGF
jgi:hypothetical protein